MVNLNLRHSCYSCKFKTLERGSDIILADFWGIDEIDPQMDDNKGTSLIIAHSHKGLKLLESCKLNLSPKTPYQAIRAGHNTSAVKSAEQTKRSAMYMKDVFRWGVIKTYRYYYQANIFQKVHRKMREFFK